MGRAHLERLLAAYGPHVNVYLTNIERRPALNDARATVVRYDVDQDALADYHRPRIQPLIDAGIDLLVFETIPCLSEARALASLLSEDGVAHIPTWVSFCLGSADRVASGDGLLACVDALFGVPQLAGIGVNCGRPMHTVTAIASLRPITERTLVAYPNRGGVYQGDARQWACAKNAVDTQQWANALFDAGADVVGGCCQTTPDDVRLLRQLRDQRFSR